VRSFLAEAWAARELAVAARGPANVPELEVDLESEHVPGPMRVRVPVPVGSAAGAVLGAGERMCGVPLAAAAGCYGAMSGVPALVSQVVWWCCQFTVGARLDV
jgi:hypothetical protein